jgi:hypothetical protein
MPVDKARATSNLLFVIRLSSRGSSPACPHGGERRGICFSLFGAILKMPRKRKEQRVPLLLLRNWRGGAKQSLVLWRLVTLSSRGNSPVCLHAGE